MRIIDEKGRIFGKINVIDFLAILFLVSFTPMLYFGYKIINKKPEIEAPIQKEKEPKKDFVVIEIDCLFIELKPEIEKIISVGDKELDKNGELIGEVVDVGEISPYTYEFEIGTVEKLTKVDSILKQIFIKLRIRAEKRQNNIYYKDKQILNNGIILFITDKYQTKAVCLLKKNGKPIMTESEEAQVEKRLTDIEEKLDILQKRVDGLLPIKE